MTSPALAWGRLRRPMGQSIHKREDTEEKQDPGTEEFTQSKGSVIALPLPVSWGSLSGLCSDFVFDCPVVAIFSPSVSD